MTELSSDPPFPGAHSQVPGGHAELAGQSPPEQVGPTRLPVEAAPVRSRGGWVIRLPVRAEQVTVSKQVVVRERVMVGRRVVHGVSRVEAELSRERLRVDSHGDVDLTPPPRTMAHDRE